jgi:membrane protease YdiL (CAAX protease family)
MPNNPGMQATRPSGSATGFLAWVFASTWLFQLPLLLAQRGVLAGPAERFMPLVVLGFFGPLLIALLLSSFDARRQGLRTLLAPLTIARVAPGWYLLALTLPCVIFLGTRALLGAFAENRGPFFYPPSQPQHIAAMLLIPFTEQIPWRGHLYPRLQRAHGPLLASLITGGAWALFHVQKHAFIDPNARKVTMRASWRWRVEPTAVRGARGFFVGLELLPRGRLARSAHARTVSGAARVTVQGSS